MYKIFVEMHHLALERNGIMPICTVCLTVVFYLFLPILTNLTIIVKPKLISLWHHTQWKQLSLFTPRLCSTSRVLGVSHVPSGVKQTPAILRQMFENIDYTEQDLLRISNLFITSYGTDPNDEISKFWILNSPWWGL